MAFGYLYAFPVPSNVYAMGAALDCLCATNIFQFSKRHSITKYYMCILATTDLEASRSTWESGATQSQNSYKPSQDLWEAILQKRTIPVQRLARSLSTVRQRHRHPITLVSRGYKPDNLDEFSHGDMVRNEKFRFVQNR